MKRLLSLLIVLISIFTFSVKAEEIVSIENLTCTSISKREASEVNVQVSGTTITTSDITFRNIRDNITCTFDVKNNSNKDIITIDEEAINNKSNENITYEVTSNDTSFIKALGTKTYQLKITYIKEYEEDKTIDNDLTITYKINKVLNPKTGINYIIQISLGVLVIIGMYLLIRSKNKTVYKGFVFILGLVLTIPLIVNATETNSVKVKSKIKVEDRGAATLVTNANRSDEFKSVANYDSRIAKLIFLDYVDVPAGVTSYDISVEGNNNIVAYLLPNEEDNTFNDLYIASEHRIYGNEDMSYWFNNYAGFMYTYEIVDFVLYRSDRVKKYYYTFTNFGKVATKPINLDFTTQTMNNVETMEGMFNYAASNSKGGTLNFKGIRFPKNESLYKTFSYAFNAANGDVSLDVSNWDVSHVKTFASMFESTADRITGNLEFKIDNDWDLSGVDETGLNYFESGLYSFMRNFVGNAPNRKELKVDLSNWNVSKVKTFRTAFYWFWGGDTDNDDNYVELNVSNWDLNNATDVYEIFHDFGYRAKGTVKLIANNWDFSKNTTVTSLEKANCYIGEYSNKTYIEMKNWDVRNIQSFYYLFNYNGSKSKDVTMDLRGWNASSVNELYSAFAGITTDSPEANMIINLNDWIWPDTIASANYLFESSSKNQGKKRIYANTLDFTKITNYNGIFGSANVGTDFKIYVKDEASQDFIMSLTGYNRPSGFVKNEHVLIYNGEAD